MRLAVCLFVGVLIFLLRRRTDQETGDAASRPAMLPLVSAVKLLQCLLRKLGRPPDIRRKVITIVGFGFFYVPACRIVVVVFVQCLAFEKRNRGANTGRSLRRRILCRNGFKPVLNVPFGDIKSLAFRRREVILDIASAMETLDAQLPHEFTQ